MTIALIGGYGQLGTALQQRLGERAVSLGRADCDLLDPDSLERMFDRVQPSAVVNCAAYNFVDRAEQEPEAALAVNAGGPEELARRCAERDVALVHVSTDYVFGGDGDRRTPYTEEDAPAPLNAYGRSKLEGERRVARTWSRHFIVRTCGLYGASRSAGKGNFVETMLRLAGERDLLKVVNDQRCTPTYAADAADAIAGLLETEAYGLYHATNAGETTWFALACEIFRQTRTSVRVEPITTAEFGAPARRPAYSVLNCDKLAEVTGVRLPDWKAGLAGYLKSREMR